MNIRIFTYYHEKRVTNWNQKKEISCANEIPPLPTGSTAEVRSVYGKSKAFLPSEVSPSFVSPSGTKCKLRSRKEIYINTPLFYFPCLEVRKVTALFPPSRPNVPNYGFIGKENGSKMEKKENTVF